MGGWSILPSKSDRANGRLVRACLAELFGTASVMFWGAGAVIGEENAINLAFGFGIATAVSAYIFHDISGAHFNPAVSLAMFIAQRISIVRCALYWVMQFLGAILGAAMLKLLHGETPAMVDLRTKTSTVEGVEQWNGFLCEAIGSIAVIYTYLAATNKFRGHRVSSYDFPLTVGLAIFTVTLTLQPLTGSGINPARALMINSVGSDVPHRIWVYIVGPLVAAIVGALSYELIFSFPLKPVVFEKKGDQQSDGIKETRSEDLVIGNPGANGGI